MKIEPHEMCNGTGKVRHNYAGTSRPCSWCKGLGKLNRDFRAFASERGMKMAKYSRPCADCKGTGIKTYSENATDHCYGGCGGTGWMVTEAHIGDILPDEIGICDYVPREVWEQLFPEFTMDVVRQDRGQSFLEAYIGIGLYSCTDYGTGWDSKDVDFLSQVRENLVGDHPQWTKLVDKETRQIHTHITVVLNRSGYNVTTRTPGLDIVGGK